MSAPCFIFFFLKKKDDQPFDPLIVTSQFNHIFCVVRPEKLSGETHYRIAFANKAGVRPYGPFLPENSIFSKSSEFRDFLLTKLINAERAAMYSNHFKAKLITTRKIHLTNIVENFSGEKRKGNKQVLKLANSPSQSRVSGSPPGNVIIEEFDQITNVGMRLLEILQVVFTLRDFDKIQLEDAKKLVQEAFQWTISASAVSGESRQQQNGLMDLSTGLTAAANNLVDLILNHQHGISSGELVLKQSAKLFRGALVDFFQAISRFKSVQVLTTQKNNIDLLLLRLNKL